MIYFYKSSCNSDTKNVITVIANSLEKANAVVNRAFMRWGYKGYPKRLAV